MLDPKKLFVFFGVFIVLCDKTNTKSPESSSEYYCFCDPDNTSIDECSCDTETVDNYNNIKIFPRLSSLLVKDYFRYFKVNLRRECPFWADDSKCAMRSCHVQPCDEHQLPIGLKGDPPSTNHTKLEEHAKETIEKDTGGFSTIIDDPAQKIDIFHHNPQTQKSRGETHIDNNSKLETTAANPAAKYSKQVNENCRGLNQDHDEELSYLNTSISQKTRQELKLWTALDNFCIIEDNDNEAEFVDLLLNPERYTGYKGESARRIWRSIYLENCFRPNLGYNLYIQSEKLNSMCLEERVYYRAISGLHTSINIHLSANYLLHGTAVAPHETWGPNLNEFLRRFSKATTNGEGPNWIKNLYFVYLLELRAIAKAASILEQEQYYTGNDIEDWETRMAVADVLKVIKSFPHHFDESPMFQTNQNIKEQFKERFRNVTRIMDCVGCDKCRLWGKLQTRGLGTALKILFSSNEDLSLKRGEIVALFNAFGRLSNSIYKLDDFRQMLDEMDLEQEQNRNIGSDKWSDKIWV